MPKEGCYGREVRLLLAISCCLAALLACGWWWTHRTHDGQLDAQVSLGPSCQHKNPPRACRRLQGHPLQVALFGVHNNTFFRVYTTDGSGHLHVRVPEGKYWIEFEYGNTGMLTNRAQKPFTVTGHGVDIGPVWPRVFRPYNGLG